MKDYLDHIKQGLADLWQDDRGAEGLEKVLILAAVALPLLAVLLFFAGDIREWVSDNWDSVVGTSGNNNDVGDNPFSGAP